MSELRYAFRALRGSPWYSATVVAVLGISLALTTVVFAVVDGVLFKPVPFPHANELYFVRVERPAAPAADSAPVSFRDIDAWTAAAPELRVTAASFPHRFKRTNREYWAAEVDERFFDVIGTRPMTGGFSSEDFDWYQPDQNRAVRPVLVSYRYWVNELGADPNAVGRIDDAWRREGVQWGFRVAGILPPDFVFPHDSSEPQPEILSPIPRSVRDSVRTDYLALLRAPSPTAIPDIRERLLGASRRAAAAARPTGHPPEARIGDLHVLRVVDELGRSERPAFALTFAAAGLLLLLACVNVAGLATARNIERRHALVVRRALAARGITLVRGELCELGLLVLAAAGAAVLLAQPLLMWTVGLLPQSVTLLKTPAIDGRVLAATAACGVVCVGLVAIWPIRVATRSSTVLLPGAVSSTASRATRRSGFVLVSSQLALAFVLLTAGALTVTSLAAAWRTESGYRRDRMILVESYIRDYSSGAEATAALHQLRDLLVRLPGVARLATSSIQPFFDSSTQQTLTGLQPSGWTGDPPPVAMRQVSPEFFDVMGMRLVDGRWPADSEWTVDQPVAIVSETAARKLWPGRPSIGQLLVPNGRRTGTSRTVIGVVADARFVALDRDPGGDLYVPDRFEPGRTGVFFHLRTDDAAVGVLPLVARTLRERNVYTNQVSTHEDALFASVKHRALPAWLFGSLGTGALLLTGVGILGLLAMSSAQRTHEMGIRIALGTTPSGVIGLMLREQLVPVISGLLLGAAVSSVVARYAESLLYGVGVYDPTAWSIVGVALVLVAGAGTLVPALHAARIDPVVALRKD